MTKRFFFFLTRREKCTENEAAGVVEALLRSFILACVGPSLGAEHGRTVTAFLLLPHHIN